MAKVGSANKISNEEIEAKVEEFAKKLEILRVRYEQYFIGVEKTAPSVMRMDVVRIMRDLEQMQVKNTAIKFKIRQCIQKFTSYSTYWNRTLREIEDGRYKRHIDRAKRNIAAETVKKEVVPEVHHVEKTQAVADEAEAFLASLGIASQPKTQPQPPVQPSTQPTHKSQPALEKLSASDARAGTPATDTRTLLRSRRPTIVSSTMHAITPPETQSVPMSAASKPAPVASSNLSNESHRPTIVQSASRPAVSSGVTPAQPSTTPSVQLTAPKAPAPVPRKRAITIVQAISSPVVAPDPAPTFTPPASAANPANKPPLPKPPALPTLNKSTNTTGLKPGPQLPTFNRKDP